MKYSCKGCQYSTDNKTLYEQHKNTKKHLKLSETDDTNKTCVECDKTFSTPSNYYKHRNKYHQVINTQKAIIINDDKINDLIAENKILKDRLLKYEEDLNNAQKKIIQLYESMVIKMEQKIE